MHEKIITDPKAVSTEDLTGHAKDIGLNVEKFKECLESGKHASEIRSDIAAGSKAGIRGTPSFLLGLTYPKSSTVKATKMLRGAVPFAQFKNMIESLLASEKE